MTERYVLPDNFYTIGLGYKSPKETTVKRNCFNRVSAWGGLRAKLFRKPLFLFLLFFIPAWFLSAQQSFFIEPGTEIRSGQITRGYCLEYTQLPLTTGNITKLTHMIGNVTVLYTDGAVREQGFDELYRDNPPSITGFDSFQFIKLVFDPSIEKITVGDSGIILARTDSDLEFITNNAKTIIDARKTGASHTEAQSIAWQAEWEPVPFLDEERNTTMIDNRGRTGTPEGEETVTGFTDDASVTFRYPNGTYSNFDAVEPALTGGGTVFITHNHSDHLSKGGLEQALAEGLQGALYVPMFLRVGSMKNSAFNTLTALADSGKYDFDIQNLMCQLLPQGVKGITHITNSSIGGFFYSQYTLDNGTKDPVGIEIFRYLNPGSTNTDGAVYRVSYKGITWLIPGDFDDEKALKELFEQSEENMKKQAEIQEEIFQLEGESYAIPGYEELIDKIERHDKLVNRLDELKRRITLMGFPNSMALIRASLYANELVSLENELAGSPAFKEWDRIGKRIAELENEYLRLPVVKAYYLKWPHHAHIFKDGELYGKIKSAVDPFYIILQPYPTQKKGLETLKETLKGHSLEYLDSSEHPVEMWSFEHRSLPRYRAG
jgi:hypothetical protein